MNYLFNPYFDSLHEPNKGLGQKSNSQKNSLHQLSLIIPIYVSSHFVAKSNGHGERSRGYKPTVLLTGTPTISPSTFASASTISAQAPPPSSPAFSLPYSRLE